MASCSFVTRLGYPAYRSFSVVGCCCEILKAFNPHSMTIPPMYRPGPANLFRDLRYKPSAVFPILTGGPSRTGGTRKLYACREAKVWKSFRFSRTGPQLSLGIKQGASGFASGCYVKSCVGTSAWRRRHFADGRRTGKAVRHQPCLTSTIHRRRFRAPVNISIRCIAEAVVMVRGLPEADLTFTRPLSEPQRLITPQARCRVAELQSSYRMILPDLFGAVGIAPLGFDKKPNLTSASVNKKKIWR